MKITVTAIILLLIINSVLIGGDTAGGDHALDDSLTQFAKWRSCLESQLPADKKKIYEDSYAKPGGTDMSKFRRGISAVLGSYGLLSDHKIDLKTTELTATSVNSPELKKAFEDCPKDEKNTSEDRMIKCVIDHLEVNCSFAQNEE